MDEKRTVAVVAALIWDKNRFMICQRPAHKTRGLQWEFVGGKVEKGETNAEALIRECREELDIPVLPGTLFHQLRHEYEDIIVDLYVYNTVIAEGIPQLLEHHDLRWITPEQIDGYDFCPADKDILKKIKELANGNI